MNDRKRPERAAVDEFFRSVYDSLSVRVLAESAADAPPSGELEALEAEIEQARAAGTSAVPKAAARPAEKKRARS